LTTASGAEFIRLSALIARQRRELDRLAAQAAARSVVDLARGALMERLHCSAAQAQEQLVALSMEAGTSILELAAQITGEAVPPDLADPQAAMSSVTPETETASGDAARVALASAAAELAPDGSGVAAAVLEEALAPAGAVAVALCWPSPTAASGWPERPGSGPARPAAGGGFIPIWTGSRSKPPAAGSTPGGPRAARRARPRR